MAGATAPIGPAAATGEYRTGLGEAVAHQQLNANRLEKTIHVNRQGAAAADGQPQLTAHQLPAHLGPDQGCRQPVQGPAQARFQRCQQPLVRLLGHQGEIETLAPPQAVGAAVGQGGADEKLTATGHPGQGVLEAPQQRLPQPRHADQVLGTHPPQVGPHLLEVGVGLLAAAGEQKVFGAALIGMPDRQHAHHPIAGVGLYRHPQAPQLMQQVGVAERYPLGFTGGAGGVEDRGDAAGISRRPGGCRTRAGQGAFAKGQQFSPACQSCPRSSSGSSCFPSLPLKHHHQAQGAGRLAGQGQLLQQGLRFHHQRHGAAIAQDVAQFLHRCGAAAHRIGCPQPHQPLVGQQPAGAVFGEQGHHLPRPHPQGGKAGGGRLDALVQLAKAEPHRRAGVGGVQGRGVSVKPCQGLPELLQAAEATPVAALGQGLAVRRSGGPGHLDGAGGRHGRGHATIAPGLPPLQLFPGLWGPQGQAKAIGEDRQQAWRHGGGGELGPPVQQSSHRPVGQAAGHHPGEASQVAVHV